MCECQGLNLLEVPSCVERTRREAFQNCCDCYNNNECLTKKEATQYSQCTELLMSSSGALIVDNEECYSNVCLDECYMLE